MSNGTSLPFRPFMPTEATAAFYQALRSRRQAPAPEPSPSPASSPDAARFRATPQALSASSTPLEPSFTPSEPPAFIDDIFAEFREWCETKRTCWPTSLVEFLSYCEYMLAKDLGDPNLNRSHQTRLDFSWVPSVLCDIFHSNLAPSPMLHILEYFLSLLSVLILSDATSGEGGSIVYRDILLRTVAPSQGDVSLEPNFMGNLYSADDSEPTAFEPEPEEVSLVRDIRRQLYLHIIEPQ